MSKSYAESFVICHSIRGRLRVKISSIRFSDVRADILKRWLTRQAEVQRIEVRPVTGSIILFYDYQRTNPEFILELLNKYLKTHQNALAHPPRIAYRRSSLDSPKADSTHFLFGRLVKVIALTGFLAYTVVRSMIFKSPLSQAPLSAAGAVATIGAIPLLRRAWRDWHLQKGLSLFPFLAGTGILAIFIGEALTAMEVIWVTELSMLLEDYAADKSRRSIREALQVVIKTTFIVKGGVEVEIPVAEVQVGDTVMIHAGERISADGIVIGGEALVDEAYITGHSMMEVRQRGHRVFAGTIVQKGFLAIRAEQVGDETYLNRMLRIVEESLINRAPVERRADILAGRLMRLGALATAGTLVVTGDFIRTFTVMLVMACPCATVLAASTAVTFALANAARNRVLIKGGLYLEKVGEAGCFCFDKTGTITLEMPHMAEIITKGPREDPAQVLALAAAAEAHNVHPLAKAIVDAAASQGVAPLPCLGCEFVLGRGVRAMVGQDTVLVGNIQFMEESGVSAACFKARAQALIETGHTVSYIAKNGKIQGVIGVTNSIRPGTEAVLEWLRNDGVQRLFLISGDTDTVVKAVSKKLHFDDYRASLLPEEKADYMERLKAGGRQVVMVGDGVNDALALSRGTVGVAMGAGGTEVALEASDIALVDNNLERLIFVRQLSHQTLRVIEQNFWLAVSTNIIGFTSAVTGLLTPLTGGLLHIIHTLGIMLNSSRLIGWAPMIRS